jgi:hypothetical protein
MKSKILSLAGGLILSLSVQAQCTLTGLNNFYCTSDTGSQLTATCGGNSGLVIGPGVNSTNFFNPSGLQDSILLLVLPGTTTYTIDQSLPFDPDTTSGGTSVSLNDDEVSGQCQIGFSFRFFDNFYSTFQISSNGFITFGSNTDNGCCSGDYIPSSGTPNNFIAHVWNDLYPPGGGSITYQTVGTSPNRKCIINFTGIPQCCGSSYPRTSQIQLHEGCGRIEIHTASQPYAFGSSTQGIENASGTSGYATPGRNSQGWTTTNDFVAFQPTCGDTFWTYVSNGPTLDMVADSNDCFGDTNATVASNASGASPFSYTWSNGQTSANINSVPAGTYTVTVTDANGCSHSDDATVYAPNMIGFNSNITDATCETGSDGAITIGASGGTPPFSFLWGNGSTSNGQSALSPGAYGVTVTDANGCERIETLTVGYDNEDPNVDLGDDRNLCPGKITLLICPPGYASYQWSTGDSVQNLVVNAAGTYTVTVTSAAGCVGIDEINVVEVQPVQVDLGPDREGKGPIVVDAGAQFNQYLWNTGATTQTISVGASGTYTVTVADTNGCLSNDNLKVSIWPAGVYDLSDEDVAIFPNPASDIVQIVSGQTFSKISIEVIDLTGRVVFTKETSIDAREPYSIDMGALPRGQYTLKLVSGDYLIQRSLILH